MMVGQVIGARNAISWLGRLGFNMDGFPMMKDFISKNTMDSAEWMVMDKFYDTVQNALDIHGGIHEALSSEKKLKEFLFFGHQDQYAEPTEMLYLIVIINVG